MKIYAVRAIIHCRNLPAYVYREMVQPTKLSDVAITEHLLYIHRYAKTVRFGVVLTEFEFYSPGIMPKGWGGLLQRFKRIPYEGYHNSLPYVSEAWFNIPELKVSVCLVPSFLSGMKWIRENAQWLEGTLSFEPEFRDRIAGDDLTAFSDTHSKHYPLVRSEGDVVSAWMKGVSYVRVASSKELKWRRFFIALKYGTSRSRKALEFAEDIKSAVEDL